MEQFINAFTHLFGIDVFIAKTGPEWAFFDFEHERHEKGDLECWVMGRYVVFSPMTGR